MWRWMIRLNRSSVISESSVSQPAHWQAVAGPKKSACGTVRSAISSCVIPVCLTLWLLGSTCWILWRCIIITQWGRPTIVAWFTITMVWVLQLCLQTWIVVHHPPAVHLSQALHDDLATVLDSVQDDVHGVSLYQVVQRFTTESVSLCILVTKIPFTFWWWDNYDVNNIQSFFEGLLGRGSWCKWLYIVFPL